MKVSEGQILQRAKADLNRTGFLYEFFSDCWISRGSMGVAQIDGEMVRRDPGGTIEFLCPSIELLDAM